MKNIAFALDAYLPSTYTWLYNIYKNIDLYEVIFFSVCYESHGSFPLKSRDSIFMCPGYQKNISGALQQFMRRVLRIVLFESGIGSLYFTWIGKKLSVKLIHGHFGHVACSYLPVATMLHIPLVVSFYGYDYDMILNRNPRLIPKYEKLFRRAAMVLTEGEFGRNKLIRRGCRPEIIKVHHLGVEVDAIPFKRRDRTPDEPLRLIQVASFTEKKGHSVLVESIRLLQEEGYGPRIALTLIGDGPLKERIKNVVRQYGLDSNIAFTDHLPYEQLHERLLSYHVFIHPSITAADGDCEGGAPVVLLDAQATGMPVISTLHCDIPEEVIHGQTGLLVNEGNPRMLADAIKEFIEDAKLITEFGVTARRHVEENYSAVRQASRLTELYDALLSSPTRAETA
jgi:colanic acid/amylovoran biosynthesis glycosyltransferase